MNNTKKKFLLMCLFGLIFAIFGSTLAYYVWEASEEDRTSIVFTVEGNFQCAVDGGGDITSDDVMLAPAECTNSKYAIQREVKVMPTINDEDIGVLMDLWLNVNNIGIGLLESDNFKYAITKNPDSCTEDYITGGTFKGISSGNVLLFSDKSYKETMEDIYYLYIWLDEEETDIATANQEFSLSLGGTCASDKSTVTFEANGGVFGTESNSKGEYVYGISYGNLPVPTKEGYTFVEWNTSEDGSGETITSETIVNVAGNYTLYAQWRVSKVNINYSVNGGQVTTSTTSFDGSVTYDWSIENNVLYVNNDVLVDSILYGENIETLVNYNDSNYLNITRSGYKVRSDEWICLSGCTEDGKTYDQDTSYNGSDFCDASNGDCTVVLGVNWEENTYTVSYNANGGSSAPGEQTKIHGVDLNLSSDKPMRTGYTFLGWSTTSDATDATYLAGEEFTVDSNVTLYAVWSVNSYYFDLAWTLDGNNFSGTTLTTVGLKIDGVDKGYVSDYHQQHPYGVSWEIYGIKLNDTAINYTISGTIGAEDTSHTIALNTLTINVNNLSYISVSNTSLYVVTGTTYTTSENILSLSDGRSITATLKTVAGYNVSFGNWSSTKGTINSTTTITANALYILKTYTISYNANGGSGTIDSQTKTYGVTLTLSSEKPTRTGYAFLGWSTSSSAVTATYASSGEYTDNSSATLYAVWQLINPVSAYSCANASSGSSYVFTYTGNCTMINDGDGNWRVKFLSDGTFKSNVAMNIDVFLVGGGGGGSGDYGSGGGGGGGGYTRTTFVSVKTSTDYKLTIGSGGSGANVFGSGGTGGTTSGFGASAAGGKGGSNTTGGGGGSGGGGTSGTGGNDGGNGSSGVGSGGTGQGTTTREFGESTGTLYAGGGGGGYGSGGRGAGGSGGGGAGGYNGAGSTGGTNTGGGGGGGSYGSGKGGAGGTGIIVIRNSAKTGLSFDFEYTGSYEIIDDGEDNWRIKFLTSGTFKSDSALSVDIFLVGGGGGGSGDYGSGAGGGGGGYTLTKKSVSIAKSTSYTLTIGGGGSGANVFGSGGTGGTTSGFGASAAGGKGGSNTVGGSGGSGGGGTSGNGGSNGSSGGVGVGSGGTGQGTTTREFGESTGTLYAGGGGGGYGSGGRGAGGSGGGGIGGYNGDGSTGGTNTGGGGGGGSYGSGKGGAGGTGIIVIRNAR